MDQQQPQAHINQKTEGEIKLDPKLLTWIDLAIGVLAVLFLFLPAIKLLTLFLALLGLALGVFVYLQHRQALTLVAVVLNAFPLFFFFLLLLLRQYADVLMGASFFE